MTLSLGGCIPVDAGYSATGKIQNAEIHSVMTSGTYGGVVAGEHLVTVSDADSEAGSNLKIPPQNGRLDSGLMVTVREGQQNQFEFRLHSKP